MSVRLPPEGVAALRVRLLVRNARPVTGENAGQSVAVRPAETIFSAYLTDIFARKVEFFSTLSGDPWTTIDPMPFTEASTASLA